MSEVKPLRWSFLVTFPIILVAIWGVLSALAHVQRAQLTRELTKIATHGTVKAAHAALREMARLPEPPLEAIVAASASPSRKVALEAQKSITELLRKWQRQLAKSSGSKRIAARLMRLASSLDNERDSFAIIDHPWLAKTTESIIRLANTAPPEDALGLAVHCESLLMLTSGHAQNHLPEIVPVASTAIERESASTFASPSRIALQSIAPDEEASQAPIIEIGDSNSTAPVGKLHVLQPGPDEFSHAPAPQLFDRRHYSAAKIAIPISSDKSQPAAEAPASPWAKINSRSMLERWLAADSASKEQIERELKRRGFENVRADIVRLALSEDTQGRVQLVHDLLSTRGSGAKAWLMLLAEDQNAEVRLSAVTVMATSNDAELIEKAWQVAVHDQDPRIADLAQRLRARRQ